MISYSIIRYHKMPKHQVNFQKCLIYKIQHLDNEELLYVGHTTDFIRRQYAHKVCCMNKNSKAYNLKLYEIIRSNGDWDMFSMVLIHKFPCNSKLEACKEEDKVMREFKTTMNTNSAWVNKEDYGKEYYAKNREQKIEISKKWYSENKEVSQEYYKENKEHISNSQKEYRDKNKEKIDELSLKHRQNLIHKIMNKYEEIKHNKFYCGCGSIFIDRPSNHNNHFKSDKHQIYLKNIKCK